MTNTPQQTPKQIAWHDAYAQVEALWEESRINNPELDDDQLHTYRAELEAILEHLDTRMTELFPTN